MTDTDQDFLRVYKRRWFVLAVVAGLNISNATIWISFASVADIATHYYDVSEDSINLLSIVFLITTIFPGILIMWYVDRSGLRTAILFGAWCNAFGSSLRFVARFCPKPYPLCLTGQIIAGIAQPFIFFIQTKVAEKWFPDHQRTLATSVIALANPVGLMIGIGVTPLFVSEPDHIPLMNMVWCIPCVVCAVIASLGICSSLPPSPPSSSAAIITFYPYLHGVKELFTNKAYLLLLLYVGCAVGSFSAIMPLLEEILCSRGYDNSFSGLCGALMVGCGLVGGAVSSIVVDKTKMFILIMKTAAGLMCISFCFFSVVTRHSDWKIPIAIVCSLVGITGFSTFPIGLELGVECSFPTVPEATSTGFIIISGQLQGVIYLAVMRELTLQIENNKIACDKNSNSDMTYSFIALNAMVVLCGIVFILFFDTEYKRRKADLIARVREILGSAVNSSEDSMEQSIRTDYQYS